VARDTLEILLNLLARSHFEAAPDLEEGTHGLETELAVCTMKSVFLYFMWKIRTLKQQLAEGSDRVDHDDIQRFIQRRDDFSTKLLKLIQVRAGADQLRLTAAGVFLDLHTLLSTLRQLPSPLPQLPEGFQDSDALLSRLIPEVSPAQQSALLSVFAAAEQGYAKKTRRALEVADDDEPLDSDSDSDVDDQNDEDDEAAEAAQRARHDQALIYEQRFCELAGKIVLAIIAKVVDASGPQSGRLRERLQRNRGRLGQNYKEVVAYLDEPKDKRSKKKGGPVQKETSKPRSEEVVVEDEEEEIEDEVMEEGGELDLRDKELTAEDNEHESAQEEEVGEGAQSDDLEDDIMGD
jgi:cohesin complex subunit SA-1/2